jgi:hypothetical protein
MSMDRCCCCDSPVDTDFDLDCYDQPGAKDTDCVCERCRERATDAQEALEWKQQA